MRDPTKETRIVATDEFWICPQFKGSITIMGELLLLKGSITIVRPCIEQFKSSLMIKYFVKYKYPNTNTFIQEIQKYLNTYKYFCAFIL